MPGWSTFGEFLAQSLQTDESERGALVEQFLEEHPVSPWTGNDGATFFYCADADEAISDIALNLDTIPGDPPFAPMSNLPGTRLWYVRRPFMPDDLLDYMLAVNDPMTPLAGERDIVGRVTRYWRPDPRNPLRMQASGMNVSVLRMGESRPFPDWTTFRVPRGKMKEHPLDSAALGWSGRRISVYTPPGYDRAQAYPLLILYDAQWMTGALQAPQIADTLIKHGRLAPVVIAMIPSPSQGERDREYIANDDQNRFLRDELLPMLQSHYTLNSAQIGIGGISAGALAGAYAALHDPSLYSRLLMISPPLGRGADADKLQRLVAQFAEMPTLPRRVFQSVGRYEAKGRFLRPALALRDTLEARAARGDDVRYQFVETGSGHGLVGFKSILPEALTWTFPGAALS